VLHVGRLALLKHLHEQAPGPTLDFW